MKEIFKCCFGLNQYLVTANSVVYMWRLAFGEAFYFVSHSEQELLTFIRVTRRDRWSATNISRLTYSPLTARGKTTNFKETWTFWSPVRLQQSVCTSKFTSVKLAKVVFIYLFIIYSVRYVFFLMRKKAFTQPVWYGYSFSQYANS